MFAGLIPLPVPSLSDLHPMQRGHLIIDSIASHGPRPVLSLGSRQSQESQWTQSVVESHHNHVVDVCEVIAVIQTKLDSIAEVPAAKHNEKRAETTSREHVARHDTAAEPRGKFATDPPP